MATVANAGMADFMNQMIAAIRGNDCTAVVRETQTCLFNNLDVSSCVNFELGCCNDMNSNVITCKNKKTLYNIAGQVIENIYNQSDPAIIGYIAKQVDATDTSLTTIQQQVSNQLYQTCNDFEITQQSFDIPSITAHQCSDVFINFANNMNANVRCAMGYINKILPTTPLAPSSGPSGPNPLVNFFHLHKEGVYILIGLGIVFVVLLVLILAFKFSAISKSKPAE